MRLTSRAASLLLTGIGSLSAGAYVTTARGTSLSSRTALSAAFARPTLATRTRTLPRPIIPSARRASEALYATSPGGEGNADEGSKEDENPANPYADPNYPDIEFVNYDDPEYRSADQGDDYSPEEEAIVSSAMSEEEANVKVEEFREYRRCRNDEYQFETYFAEVLRGGELFRGEWEVYRTSTFLPGQEDRVDGNGMPALVKAQEVLRMVSSGAKVKVDTDSERRVDSERIVHEERMSTEKSSSSEREEFEAEGKSNRYWPELLGPYDFRGEQGIMVVGNAYTICDSVPLGGEAGSGDDDSDDGTNDGPFSELRAEVGLQYKRMRFRVKFDYRVKDGAASLGTAIPPLSLRSMTVCREARERWPRYGPERTDVDDAATAALFGPPGASGGLYDPPPVGSDEQATKYMMIDLEGGATVLFPHTIDQAPDASDGNGWVTSLDWSPGRIRYQVDRKVLGGTKVKGLRTLELSEVQGHDVDRWRPQDGGQDMRQ